MSQGANDSYGSIYYPSFNSSNPSNNIIAYDDNSGGDLQFQIIMHMKANTEYILVVTTAVRNRTGPYTIIVSGLNSATLNRVYESDPVTTTTAPTTDNSRQTVIIAVVVAVVSVLIVVFVVLAIQQCKTFIILLNFLQNISFFFSLHFKQKN